jgi:hypothetical protein
MTGINGKKIALPTEARPHLETALVQINGALSTRMAKSGAFSFWGPKSFDMMIA